MKGLGLTSTAIAAATWFAASAVAQLDPIVIKVRSFPSPLPHEIAAHTDINVLGLKILLQDEWHGIVSITGRTMLTQSLTAPCHSFIRGVAYQRMHALSFVMTYHLTCNRGLRWQWIDLVVKWLWLHRSTN